MDEIRGKNMTKRNKKIESADSLNQADVAKLNQSEIEVKEANHGIEY